MRKSRLIRKDASAFVMSSGRLYKLVISLCLFLQLVFMPLLLFTYPSEILADSFEGTWVGAVCIILNILPIPFWIFLSLPLMMGIFTLAYKIFCGDDDASVIEIFYVFKNASLYFKALFLELMFILKAAIYIGGVVGIVVLTSYFTGKIIPETPSVIIKTFLLMMLMFITVMILSIIALTVFLTKGFFLTPYFICAGERPFVAMKMSRQTLKGRKKNVWGFLIGEIPIVLLSLASFGMIFIAYSAPMLIMAYFIYANEIMLINNRNKEVNNNGEQQ